MRSLRKHFSQDCLGKFCSSDSLNRILSCSTLNWSSPAEFNDPFDCQVRPIIPPYSNEIELLGIEEATNVIEGKVAIYSPNSSLIAAKSQSARIQHLERSLDVYEFYDVVNKSLRLLCGPSAAGLEMRLVDSISPEFLNLKILCLTKAFDNLLMWSHYADQHRGALLIFKPLQIGGDFNEAKEVQYRDSMPVILSGREMAKMVTGQITIGDDDIIERYIREMTLIKGIDWSYELEWRIFRGVNAELQDSKVFRPFAPSELHAVVMGCRMDENTEETLIKSFRPNYPETKWFKALRQTSRFELGIEEL